MFNLFEVIITKSNSASVSMNKKFFNPTKKPKQPFDDLVSVLVRIVCTLVELNRATMNKMHIGNVRMSCHIPIVHVCIYRALCWCSYCHNASNWLF